MAPSPQETKTGAQPAAAAAGTDRQSESMPVEAIMGRIHGEVLSAGGALPPSIYPASSSASFKLASWQPSAPRIAVKQEYALDELLAFSDRDFIENAYRAVLRRGPDEGGMSHHLTRLRNGVESKVGILAALRWSPEGEKAGVHVDGLLAPFLLQKWRGKRFIGPLIGWVHSLVRLGSLADRQVMLDAAQARESHELGRVMNLQAQQLEKLLAESDTARAREALVSSLALEALSARVDAAIARLPELEGINGRLASLVAMFESMQGELRERVGEVAQVRAHSSEVAAQVGGLSARLDALADVRAHSHAVAEQVGGLSARLDALADVREHSHAVAGQVGELSVRMGAIDQVRAHSFEVASQVGALSLRMNEVADLRAHASALAGHVGTLSTRLDELAGVGAHSHAVADQVGTLSTRLDQLAAVAAQAKALAYRVDTLTARLDGQPDVVPVIRLLSERLEKLAHSSASAAVDGTDGRRGAANEH